MRQNQFVTPNQRHLGEDKSILQKRHVVYQMAKLQRPDRWSRKTRNWEPENHVTLNPDKKQILKDGGSFRKNRAA